MGFPKIHSQERELALSEAIVERRSTPSFDGSPVLDEALKTILWSGIEATRSFNLQPWRFIVVRDAQRSGMVPIRLARHETQNHPLGWFAGGGGIRR